MTLPIGAYTFYNQFENCPHKAWHIYVLKDIPYVETPEMQWGNDVHSAMEHRIKDGTPLPDTMKNAEAVGDMFRQIYTTLPVFVEYKLAMTAKGMPIDYWSKDAWFRAKLDCCIFDVQRVHAWCIDWKTGNVREDPFELEIAALLLKVNRPNLITIVGEYFWMKTGQNGLRYTLNRPDTTFARLQTLRTEAESYERAGEWPKRKNPLCGWCPVTSCENNTSHKRK